MKMMRVISTFLARFFLSLVFLISGFETLSNHHEAEKKLLDALCEWHHFAGFSESVQGCLTVLVPWAFVIVIVWVLFELVGGVMVLIGYRERIGAVLLILFWVPTTLLFHSFWFFEGPMRDLQLMLFSRNLAILGGLILVVIHGAHTRSEGSSPSSLGGF